MPEASLGELASELELSRGRVQRALERIESLALHPAEDDREPDDRAFGAAPEGRAPAAAGSR